MAVHSISIETGSGATFRIDDAGGTDHVVHLVLAAGLAHYEAPYPALMARLVAALPGAHLDIGANTGLYALLMAASNPAATVHAFEPLPQIRARLQANLDLNPALAARIRVEDLALSSRTGQAVFFETINPHGLLSTSSSLDETHARAHDGVREHQIEVTTLDAWAAARSVHEIGFVKIDVEGHEADVLRGGPGTIAVCRPVLGVELLGPSDFAFFAAWLAANDYVDCELTPRGLSFGTTPRFVGDGWNHLFVPSERRWSVIEIADGLGIVTHET